ncbi:Leucine-rich repeat [Phytophthora infestans]|uniref:Leucine-rich repeat n=1 Tax=Phytophthora infestans TaxID=4787 RepID=A0A8S9TLN3_PHYIN|nr:Leucine-rich repeat [Phytophthora infestans]
MDTAYLTGSSGMLATATGGGSTVPRRSDGNVSLGLFSKIAAARKENLSTFSKAVAGDVGGQSGRNFEKKSIAGTSNFPELNDPSARNPVLRTPGIHERKTSSRSYSQNVWTKQTLPEEPSRPVSSQAPVKSSIFTAPGANRAVSAQPQYSIPVGIVSPSSRRRHALPPHQQLYHPRRPTTDSPTELPRSDREMPIKESPTRPATASEILDTRYPGYQGNVRGYVRRSPEVLSTSLDPSNTAHGWHRHSHSLQTGTADPGGRYRTRTDSMVANDMKYTGAGELPVNAPNQEVHFAVTEEIPGVPIVYRNQKTKVSNPERLNLDRRNLPVIPLLEENLLGLPNLIFLDLYNNRIEKLENLHLVPNLQVLMMGKNRLRTIENLDCLKKLDVLDLHSNKIEQMQNLNELKELRVLNLGGNMISAVENIDKLMLLTELNLRRNRIRRIGAIGTLPSLLRLFLSNNKLETFESIAPLFQVSSISELRLDSNGVCAPDQMEYRVRMINSFPSLKHLDLKPLSDADRKEALLRANSPSKSVDTAEAAARVQAISCVRANWERRSPVSSEDSRDSSFVSSWELSTKAELSSHGGYEERASTPIHREESAVYSNNAGFSELEVYGDYRVLVIYGDALDALEQTKAHALVNAISFRYLGIAKIVAAVSSATNANLKLYTRLRRFFFAYNDLQSFDELLWLNTMGLKAEEVYISQNPVCANTLLKRFIGARISNILRLNGEEINSIDRQMGKQLFPKPSVPRTRAVDAPELHPVLPSKARVKEGRDAKVPRSSSVLHSSATPSAVTEIFDAASDIEMKTTALDQAWKDMLLTIVKETLQDIERRDSFMSGCLDNL